MVLIMHVIFHDTSIKLSLKGHYPTNNIAVIAKLSKKEFPIVDLELSYLNRSKGFDLFLLSANATLYFRGILSGMNVTN